MAFRYGFHAMLKMMFLRKTMNLSVILAHCEDSPSALSVCNCDFHSEKQAGLKISWLICIVNIQIAIPKRPIKKNLQ